MHGFPFQTRLGAWRLMLLGGIAAGGMAAWAQPAGQAGGAGKSPPTSLVRIAPLELPAVVAGVGWIDQSLFALGGVFPYVWTVPQGLPEGLALSHRGRLSGRVRLPGHHALVVRVRDAEGRTADASLKLEVMQPAPLAVGNLIFIDRNRNGQADAGEGVPGVMVRLFRDGAEGLAAGPIVPAVRTDARGCYRFGGLAAGRYFVQVPPTEFQPGAPLHGLVSLPGAAADDGRDDDRGENGIDSPRPEFTGVASSVFSLSPDAEPVAGGMETGLGADDDLGVDSHSDLTIDLGFQVECPVITLAPAGASFSGVQGMAFSQQVTAIGGVAPCRFEAEGPLPAGLAFSHAGELAGTPTEPGTVVFGCRVRDAQGCQASARVSFTTRAAPQGIRLGNLVFIDENGNGTADSGEGVAGVTVNLKTAAGILVSSAQTQAGGLYEFRQVKPGTYHLEIPASFFASTAPLAGMRSLAGAMSSGDDDVAEDGLDTGDPRVSGVRTGEFRLAAGAAPTTATGETGTGARADEAEDAFGDLTRDFGFTHVLPASFALWQAAQAGQAGKGPDDNPDADRYSNLMEFALGQAADSGADDPARPGFFLERTPAGRLDAVLWRRGGGVQGLQYVIEAGGPDGWAALQGSGIITPKAGGLEEVRLEDIESDPRFAGLDAGQVRLRVVLELPAGPAEGVTPVWVWRRHTLAARPETFCMPLLRREIFAGAVDAVVTGSTLDLSRGIGGGTLAPSWVDGRSYYLEVIGGDHEGRRWEVDEARSTASMVRVDLDSPRNTQNGLPLSLRGDLIAIRPHWTFASLFPPAQFAAGTGEGTADRLITLDRATGLLREFWLCAHGGLPRWVRRGDPSLVSQNEQVLDVSDGLFLHARGGPVTLRHAGILRTNAWVCALGTGLNLVGGGWPVTQSPLERGMTSQAGFTAHLDGSLADRIHVWRGDSENRADYTRHSFMEGVSGPCWSREGEVGAVDSGSEPVFEAWRAAWVLRRAAGAWVLPPPAP
jgi:hypothetical protein